MKFKKENKLKKTTKIKEINQFLTILTLLMLMPLSYASNHSDFINQSNFRNDTQHNFKMNEITRNEFDLESAEIMLLMNKRGEILSSHTIHNLNNEEVFIISIKEENKINTYMVEPNSDITLIN